MEIFRSGHGEKFQRKSWSQKSLPFATTLFLDFASLLFYFFFTMNSSLVKQRYVGNNNSLVSFGLFFPCWVETSHKIKTFRFSNRVKRGYVNVHTLQCALYVQHGTGTARDECTHAGYIRTSGGAKKTIYAKKSNAWFICVCVCVCLFVCVRGGNRFWSSTR